MIYFIMFVVVCWWSLSSVFNSVGWVELMNSNDSAMWWSVCGFDICDGVSVCFNDCFNNAVIAINVFWDLCATHPKGKGVYM